jgi:P27 family predicted phage terminase small subunit
MRGRPPLASEIKRQSGAYDKNPQRENRFEPKAISESPDIPDAVAADPIAAKQWDMLCGLLNKMGLLSKSDQTLMELYCITFAQYRNLLEQVRKTNMVLVRKTDKGVMVERNQMYTELQKAMDRLQKLTSEFGLSPSSRSRLVSTKAFDDDESDLITKLLARGGLN